MKTIYLLAIVLFTACESKKTEQSAQASSDTLERGADKPVLTDLSFHEPRLLHYQRYLNDLDRKEAENISAATSKFKELFKPGEQSYCDSAYFLFNVFYAQVNDAINDLHFNQATPDYDSLIMNFENQTVRLSKKLTDYNDKLKSNSFEMSATEGMTFIKQDRDFVNANFYSFLTPVMTTFLEQVNRENKEGFWDDGGLVVEPQTLIDRIVWWENFERENPNFLFRSAPATIKMYTSSVITGEDNTPLFWEENGPLDVYYTTAYDYLFEKYPHSRASKLLKPYYTSLVEHDTASIRQFREQNLQE